MPLLEFEKTLTCPYNPSHQITAPRMGVHLSKCRRNHPHSGHVICPFNANHHILKPEEQYHMSICGDRKSVELLKFSLENTASVGSILPNVTYNKTDMVMTEDWESETVTGTYDPSKAAANANVLRKIEGATPSQRKEFRVQERHRLERLASGQCPDGSDDLDRTLPIPGLASQQNPASRDRHSVPLRRPSRVDHSIQLPITSDSSHSLLQVHLGRGKPMPEHRRTGPVGRSGTINSNNNKMMLGRGRGVGLQILHGGLKKAGGMQGLGLGC